MSWRRGAQMPEMSADSRGESGFKFDSRDAIGR